MKFIKVNKKVKYSLENLTLDEIKIIAYLAMYFISPNEHKNVKNYLDSNKKIINKISCLKIN